MAGDSSCRDKICELRGKGVKNVYGVKNVESLYLFTPFSYLCSKLRRYTALAVKYSSKLDLISLVCSYLCKEKNKVT